MLRLKRSNDLSKITELVQVDWVAGCVLLLYS